MLLFSDSELCFQSHWNKKLPVWPFSTTQNERKMKKIGFVLHDRLYKLSTIKLLLPFSTILCICHCFRLEGTEISHQNATVTLQNNLWFVLFAFQKKVKLIVTPDWILSRSLWLNPAVWRHLRAHWCNSNTGNKILHFYVFNQGICVNITYMIQWVQFFLHNILNIDIL